MLFGRCNTLPMTARISWCWLVILGTDSMMLASDHPVQ